MERQKGEGRREGGKGRGREASPHFTFLATLLTAIDLQWLLLPPHPRETQLKKYLHFFSPQNTTEESNRECVTHNLQCNAERPSVRLLDFSKQLCSRLQNVSLYYRACTLAHHSSMTISPCIQSARPTLHVTAASLLGRPRRAAELQRAAYIAAARYSFQWRNYVRQTEATCLCL